jgi:ABC-type uncharacterized transport system involved in gliding motility auxiliary subunit
MKRYKRLRESSIALLSLLLLFFLLVTVNFLAYRHPIRFDLSETKAFSLSPQTIEVLSALKKEVSVHAYFESKDAATVERARLLLSNYADHSPRFSFEVIDPWKNPAAARKDAITASGQAVVISDNRRETIATLDEESITNAIIKVTREKLKTIYFLTGHGERGLDHAGEEGFAEARKALEEQNYQIKALNLATLEAVPADAAAVVIAGPSQSLLPIEEDRLERYFKNGGKLLVLADPQSKFNLPAFIESVGIKARHDLVLDASGVGQALGMGPAVPLVMDYGQHPALKGIYGKLSLFPLAQSLEIAKSEKCALTPLFYSGQQSWGETDLEEETFRFDDGKDHKGPLLLGAAASCPMAAEKNNEEKSKEAKVVVVGDSDFASNRFFNAQVNRDLFLNMASWLAEDEDLLGIRPKPLANRRILLTEGQKFYLFWSLVVALPFLTIVAGLLLWYRRRRS